jgi:hypothetical protein
VQDARAGSEDIQSYKVRMGDIKRRSKAEGKKKRASS